MKNVFITILKIFLKKDKGIILLTAAILLSSLLFIFNIHKYQDQLSKQQLDCQLYINEFSGKLSAEKIEKIENLNDAFQSNQYEELIMQYKEGIINEDTYLKKQNELSNFLSRQDGFSLFYKQYLSVRANSELEICNNAIVSCLTMCNFDFIHFFIMLYIIYFIFLKDYDLQTIIYEEITILGRKYSHICKILVYLLLMITYTVVAFGIKLLVLNNYIDLDCSIHNLAWVSSDTVSISLLQYYLICIALMVLGSLLIAIIAMLCNKKIKKAPVVLVIIFTICYICKAFFGNDIIFLYLPFVSFLVPGQYFSGIGTEMEAFNIHILIFIVSISLISICIALIKSKKIFMTALCLLLLCSCTNNNQINLDETYNSYFSISFSQSDDYIFFNNWLINKTDFSLYSLFRDPLDEYQNLDTITTFNNHLIYKSHNDKNKTNIYYLDLDKMVPEKIKSLYANKRNYLNINDERSTISVENFQVKILGDKNNYIYVYNDKITDKDNNLLVEGYFSSCISLYDNCIYSLQQNNQIFKYSLDSLEVEIVDSVLCDYFFIYEGKVICHGLKDQKIYENTKLLSDIIVENFDIYQNTIYYINNGIYSYNLNTKTNTCLKEEKAYSIDVSKDGQYLYYTSDSQNQDNSISLNIYDLSTNQLVKNIQ